MITHMTASKRATQRGRVKRDFSAAAYQRAKWINQDWEAEQARRAASAPLAGGLGQYFAPAPEGPPPEPTQEEPCSST